MIKRELIVHAGQHKTGSSAIQNYLFEEFDHPDIEYIHSNRANSSLWMLQAFKNNLSDRPNFSHLSSFNEDKLKALRERARGRLEKTIENSEKSTHVISAEAFSLFRVEELEDFLSFVKPFYNKVLIHVYFRPLKSRMESAFQEKLKHRFSPISDHFRLDYKRAVESLDLVFGIENVLVHKYDRTSFSSGSVVEDFLSKIGVQVTLDKPMHVNAGLSIDAVKLLYIYRSYHPRRNDNDKMLVEMLSGLKGKPFRFHSALYRKLLVTRKNSVNWFEKRAGFSIDEETTSFDDYGVRNEEDIYDLSDSSIAWLRENSNSWLEPGYDMNDIAMSVRNLVGSAEER